MRDKVAKQLKSDKSGYDNRKYCNFFIQVRRIRTWFKLNNYKQCSNNFDAFEQSLQRLGAADPDELASQPLTFQSLPVSLQVEYCYFKGRYNLYNQ